MTVSENLDDRNPGDQKSSDQDNKPWYRQFWAWFILSPLILVVVVSSFTVTIAVRYADDRVVDDYYKEGRMINMRLEQDLLAQALNVSATVRFDTGINEVSVVLDQQSDTPLPEALSLEMSHPAQVEQDHIITLTRVAGNQYTSELSNALLDNRWYLRLSPLQKSGMKNSDNFPIKKWRLRDEINFTNAPTVVMSAALSVQ